MNESTEELASLYVLDQLDRAERAVFEARLLREPALAAFVRDLEDALARGVRDLPAPPAPVHLLGRIEAQIDALETDAADAARRWNSRSPQPGRPARRSPAWASFAGWGLAAVLALSLGTLAVQSLRRSSAPPMIVVVGLDADHTTTAELPLRSPGGDADARFIQLAAMAADFWAKPGDLPVRSTAAPSNRRGYALFDPGSRQGFIAIEQLPALTENQRYHLWIADPKTGRIHEAGALPGHATSAGLYSFSVDPAPGESTERPRFFITVEDSGQGAPLSQPRGKVVLGDERI